MSNVIKKAGRKIPAVKKLIQELDNLRIDKGILQLQKGNLEADVRGLNALAQSPRNFLSHHFIHGVGIEIGAAQLPVKIPPKAKVTYVDVFSAEDLKKAWPKEYPKLDLVKVDVVDDGEKLAKFKASSVDFIIANHFLEHCLDPIGTIINMYKKLRNKGVLYMAVPDKRYTFDKKRAITSYTHLLEEHKDKTKKKFLWEHTKDFVKLAEHHKGDIDKRSQELIDSEYRIHYHVWTQREVTEFFVRLAADFKLNLEIEAIFKNQHEVIYILRKEGASRLRNRGAGL